MQPKPVNNWIVALLWAVVLGYAAFASWTFSAGYRSAERGDTPLYTDYTPRYAASVLLQAAPAEYLYMPQAMHEAGREAARRMYGGITDAQAAEVGYSAWMYPPTFLFVVEPLAWMPYWTSWFAWMLVTGIPYLLAIRRILPDPLAWPFALAAPPVFFNLMYGQTGFLVAGLIGLGMLLLEKRPFVAGVLLGLASVKPHFGILLPLALVAGGYWKVFASAAMTVAAMIAASVQVYGDVPWFAFIGTALSYADGFAMGAFNYPSMTTVLSMFKLFGSSMQLAWNAQFLAAVMMAALVCWAWRKGRGRPDSFELRCAIVCFATPLAVPMAYLYDLVLIVPALAWLLKDMLMSKAGRGEVCWFALLLGAVLLIKPVAEFGGVQLGPLVLAGMLGMCLRRFAAIVNAAPSDTEHQSPA